VLLTIDDERRTLVAAVDFDLNALGCVQDDGPKGQ
jgi:hypothetical protein